MINIGALLKSLRVSRNLTLKEVAKNADVNASHLSEIERGRKSPKFSMVERIIASHECSIQIIISGTDIQIRGG